MSVNWLTTVSCYYLQFLSEKFFISVYSYICSEIKIDYIEFCQVSVPNIHLTLAFRTEELCTGLMDLYKFWHATRSLSVPKPLLRFRSNCRQ